MKIVVASKNPVKINATHLGFETYFDIDVVEGVSVESGVSDQPMSDSETQEGARNRAFNAQKLQPEADYWVGIEGGIEPQENALCAFAWIVVLGKNVRGESRTTSFLLPQKVASLIGEGYELGVANDMIFNKNNSKQKGGAVGILTKNKINRTQLYTQAVQLALVPIINEEIY